MILIDNGNNALFCLKLVTNCTYQKRNVNSFNKKFITIKKDTFLLYFMDNFSFIVMIIRVIHNYVEKMSKKKYNFFHNLPIIVPICFFF